MVIHKGSCHCGSVKFEVKSQSDIKVSKCNCSICKATGFIHLIVDKEAFSLISGEDDITTYTFNTHTAKHTFCKHCGIKSFYTPRSHPKGYSVNLNSLDPETITSVTYYDFNGQDWEKNVDKLKENHP